MEKQQIVVHNQSGLHARPAAVFAATAKRFASTLTIHVDGRTANGKSMVSILSAGISRGKEIEIVAEGADEKEAMAEMISLVAAGCGE